MNNSNSVLTHLSHARWDDTLPSKQEFPHAPHNNAPQQRTATTVNRKCYVALLAFISVLLSNEKKFSCYRKDECRNRTFPVRFALCFFKEPSEISAVFFST